MIPEGWESHDLAGLVEGCDYGLSCGLTTDPTGVPILRMGNLQGGRVSLVDLKYVPESQVGERDLLRPLDILVNRTNSLDLVGKTGLFDSRRRMTFASYLFRLRALPNVDPAWLAQLLSSAAYQSQLRRIATPGVSQANINRQKLLAVSVLAPPAGEQKKIAAILSSVDEAIQSTQAVVDQLQVVKKAMMGELLTRGLPGRHTTFTSTDTTQIPASWNIRPCGELFDVQLGKMMSVGARSGTELFPYLRNENVYWHRFDLADVSHLHFDARERDKYRLRAGDLLACEGRHIGRCAVWNDEIDECYYQKALHRLRPIGDEMTTDYMKFFMMLRFNHMPDIVAEANSTSTIPHLPREKLLALPVWYPPRPEQDEIAAILNSLVQRERLEESALDRLHEVKFALLSVLLTGEVRVTPAPEAP